MKDGWREETTDGDEGHKFTAFFVLLYFYDFLILRSNPFPVLDQIAQRTVETNKLEGV